MRRCCETVFLGRAALACQMRRLGHAGAIWVGAADGRAAAAAATVGGSEGQNNNLMSDDAAAHGDRVVHSMDVAGGVGKDEARVAAVNNRDSGVVGVGTNWGGTRNTLEEAVDGE